MAGHRGFPCHAQKARRQQFEHSLSGSRQAGALLRLPGHALAGRMGMLSAFSPFNPGCLSHTEPPPSLESVHPTAPDCASTDSTAPSMQPAQPGATWPEAKTNGRGLLERFVDVVGWETRSASASTPRARAVRPSASSAQAPARRRTTTGGCPVLRGTHRQSMHAGAWKRRTARPRSAQSLRGTPSGGGARTLPGWWSGQPPLGVRLCGSCGSRRRLRASALTATMMLDPDMVRAAISGRSTSPVAGSKTPAAMGRAMAL